MAHILHAVVTGNWGHLGGSRLIQRREDDGGLLGLVHLIPSMNLLNSAHTKWVSKDPANGLRLSREPQKVNVYVTVI